MTKRRLTKALKRLRNLPRGFDLVRYVGNKALSAYLKQTKSTRVAYPSTIMLEVTNQCNLKCVTCAREYAWGKEMDRGYMKLGHLKQIIDEAYPYLDSVGLTGLGETFLYKDLEHAVDYIRGKSRGIIISASINAHLEKSTEIAARLINKIDTIQISIDGLGDIYEAVRGNSKFTTFLANMRGIVAAAKDSATDIMLNVVIFDMNFRQMTDLVTFTHDEGVHFLNFTPMNVVAITGKDRSYYEFYLTDEFQQELKRAKEKAEEYPGLEFTLPNFSHLTEFAMCKYPWGHFYVSWDGFLPPCCAKPFPKELSFGSVSKDGLLTSLNSSSYREFRQIWLDGKGPEFCRNCFNAGL